MGGSPLAAIVLGRDFIGLASPGKPSENTVGIVRIGPLVRPEYQEAHAAKLREHCSCSARTTRDAVVFISARLGSAEVAPFVAMPVC